MDMIHRLRRKFLILAFAAVVLILAGALGLINGITYMKMRSEVNTLLTAIVQNDGIMPSHQPGTSTESWLSDPEWYNGTPEFAHQTRYFSVIMDESGKIRRTCPTSPPSTNSRPWKLPVPWRTAPRARGCSRINGPATATA